MKRRRLTKRHRIPRTSRRFQRKLRRAKNPLLLYLRCKRPQLWVRLQRWQMYQFFQVITNISPYESPFFSLAPRITAEDIIHNWRLDELSR